MVRNISHCSSDFGMRELLAKQIIPVAGLIKIKSEIT